MSRFVIHERGTGSFCTSTGFRTFSFNLEEAAIFSNAANADKAVKSVRGKPGKNTSDKIWTIGSNSFYSGNKADFLSSYMMAGNDPQVLAFYNNLQEQAIDLEVREIRLTLI